MSSSRDSQEFLRPLWQQQQWRRRRQWRRRPSSVLAAHGCCLLCWSGGTEAQLLRPPPHPGCSLWAGVGPGGGGGGTTASLDLQLLRQIRGVDEQTNCPAWCCRVGRSSYKCDGLTQVAGLHAYLVTALIPSWREGRDGTRPTSFLCPGTDSERTWSRRAVRPLAVFSRRPPAVTAWPRVCLSKQFTRKPICLQRQAAQLQLSHNAQDSLRRFPLLSPTVELSTSWCPQ